jgi:GT2 family glycosyltransferase
MLAPIEPATNELTSKVCAVVVNWNGAAFLERCLQALVDQTVPFSEIIVVDNASSDCSIEIVQKFSRVMLLAQEENLGFSKGNNVAIHRASADIEWIALVNPDAFLSPEWLEKMLIGSASVPGRFFGCTLLNAADPSIIDGLGDVYHFSGLAWREGHGQTYEQPVSFVATQIFAPCAAAAMYARKELLACKGFDEDFFCYMEDVDLGFRLRLRGALAYHVPDAIALHVGSGTTGGKRSEFSTYFGHRNLVWVYLKNMPSLLLWLFLPAHLLMTCVALISLTIQGQTKAVFRAKWDALLGIPAAVRKRSEINLTRTVSVWSVFKLLEFRKSFRRH